MIRALAFPLCLLLAASVSAAPVASQFTYQGELRAAGSPATGAFDMQFLLYLQADDDGSGAVASVTVPTVQVSAGLFSVELDYTDAPFIAGEQYWLEVRVRSAGSGGGFTQLLPRQKVTPTPYAISSLNVRDGGVGRAALAPGAVGSVEIEDGAVTPQKLSFTPGTVTQITAGTGLTGGTIVGTGTLGVDSSVVQARVTGSCPVGEYFRGIQANGSVLCEPVPGVPRVSTVDSAGNVGEWPSIAIGADGHPVIAYRDIDNTALKVAWCANSACSAAVVNTVDPGGNVGEYSSIAIGADGLPVIAYYDRGNGDLKVAKCANASCSGSVSISQVDSAGDVGLHTAIAVPTDGRPLITYTGPGSGSGSGLKLARCANAACTGSASVVTIDGVTNRGLFSAIAIGDDGLAVVSYLDSGSNRLRIAKCNSADCTSSETREILSDTSVLNRTSIAILDTGTPLIAFTGNLSGTTRLRVAACTNTDCSGTVFSSAMETNASRASIALGDDGIPVIASREFNRIYLTRCGEPLCSPLLSRTSSAFGKPNLDFTALAIGHDNLPVIAFRDEGAGHLVVVKCGNRSCQ